VRLAPCQCPLLCQCSSSDVATVLKEYKIRSLDPQNWEVYDHDLDQDASVSGFASGSKADEPDPLGLKKGTVLRSAGVYLLFCTQALKPCPLYHSADPSIPVAVKSSVLTHSKTFDPKVFLSTVHPGATFKDLSVGRQHLKGMSDNPISNIPFSSSSPLAESLEQRSQALKILVEQEFDHFVSVKTALTGMLLCLERGEGRANKGTIDVYDEMKDGPLAEGRDYGVGGLKDSLKRESDILTMFPPTLSDPE
jgi:exocyst complex component 2